MNKYLLFLLTLFIVQITTAQSLVINGNIVLAENSPEGSKILIYKNNEKIDEQVISKKGRFDLKLALDADYKISFEKDGYTTKLVNVNTEVPSEIVESNPDFPPVKLIINLLPRVEGVDLSIFEQPIAILAYNYELDDFTFDKEYSDKIRDRVAQTEREIKRVLAEKGSKSLEQERMFKDLAEKGQASFNNSEWTAAIGHWQKALAIKPDFVELKPKIAEAQRNIDAENARKNLELEKARQFSALVASGDSLFNLKKYSDAKGKYIEAVKINEEDKYPSRKISEIDALLANILAQQKKEADLKALAAEYKKNIDLADQAFAKENYDEAEKSYRQAIALNYENNYPNQQIQLIASKQKQLADNQKRLADIEANYKKTLEAADKYFAAKDYANALNTYREAAKAKPSESYPAEMIAKAEKAIREENERIAAEKAAKEKEMARRASLQSEYDRLIAEADQAFKTENYSLAKLRYTEANNLNLGIEYPKKQLQEIENIFNSTKYKARLAEYNKYKSMAEKDMANKNYASSKFYYQKAIGILPIDKELINKKVAEIDSLIEAEQLAAMLKTYKGHIEKADKALNEKAYAVAKFYYQKALEVKIGDKYAKSQLEEVEKHINERQEKGAEL